MHGFEAGTSGMLAMQHLATVRAEAEGPRPARAHRMRHGVGVGLVRLGERLAGPLPA